LIMALAAAARAAADFEEEEERLRLEAEAAEGNEVNVNPNLTPEGRLAAVLEVNRLLHGSLAEKKTLLADSQNEVKQLNALLDRRAIEEPARRHQIDQLQERIQVTESNGHITSNGHAAREAKALAKDIAKMEEKVNQANDANLILADRHRLDRARMVEQQSRLRTLGKRERELARHLDFLATKLNDAVSDFQTGHEFYQQLPADMPKDFKNLKGLRVNKLVGMNPQAPPPQLVTYVEKDDKQVKQKDISRDSAFMRYLDTEAGVQAARTSSPIAEETSS